MLSGRSKEEYAKEVQSGADAPEASDQPTPITSAQADGGSGVLGGEVLVLHLPRMIERVEGRVSDEERQRP